MSDRLTAIIVDDEPRLAQGLHGMLQQHCPHLNVLAVCYSADDAALQIKAVKPKLLFLDISMPGKNAFDLLADLKEHFFEIIFITAHNQYAIQAFKYSACGYLLKPLDEDELVEAVTRAEKRIKENNYQASIDTLVENWQQRHFKDEQKICLPTVNGFQVISLKDVIYCEANNSYTNFMLTSSKKICASKHLLEYESLLLNDAFLRVHKSYLINMHHITSYTRGEGGIVTMVDGTELEVSRRKKDIFLEKMKMFFKY